MSQVIIMLNVNQIFVKSLLVKDTAIRKKDGNGLTKSVLEVVRVAKEDTILEATEATSSTRLVKTVKINSRSLKKIKSSSSKLSIRWRCGFGVHIGRDVL